MSTSVLTDYPTLYLAVSILVALMMLIESYILTKTGGKFLGHAALNIMSLLEFVWLLMSAVALFKLEFVDWTRVVPVVYVLFNVFAWGYGMYVFRKEGLLDKVAEQGDAADIAIPQKYRDFTLSFAMVFLALSTAALTYVMMQP